MPEESETPDDLDLDGELDDLDDEEVDVEGFVLDPPLMLGACTCGHDLADHLLDNGGAVCRFTARHLCTCVHFTFA